MKKLLGLLIAVLSLNFLFSCSGKEIINEEVETTHIVYTKLEDNNGKKNHEESVKFNYSAFNEPATKESKDIAVLAYKLSWFSENYVGTITSGENKGKKDYSLGYKNIKEAYGGLGLDSLTNGFYYSDGYKIKPTKDSIGFAIGRKEFDKTAVVVVTVRGFGYDSEWISNFEVGKTGDHKGYNDSAVKVIDGIKNYLKDVNKPNIKILVTGYSKGGAIANQVGKLLVDDIASYEKISKDNLYVYSFNSPQTTIQKNDLEKYNNIFVYYSKNDVVHHILPSLGFNNVGNQIDIFYNEFYDDLAKQYKYTKKEFSEATFNLVSMKVEPKETDIKTIDKFLEKAFKMLYFDSDNPEYFIIGTREKFMDNLFDSIEYLFSLVYDDENNYVGAFKNLSIDKIGVSNLLNLFVKDSHALYDIVKKIFDDAKLPYDEAKLKKACDAFQNTLYTYFIQYNVEFLNLVASAIYNINTILPNHYPEGFTLMMDHYIKL